MKESKNKRCPHADRCTDNTCIHKKLHGFCNQTFPCEHAPGTWAYEVDVKIPTKKGIKIVKAIRRTSELVRCKKYKKLEAKILSL